MPASAVYVRSRARLVTRKVWVASLVVLVFSTAEGFAIGGPRASAAAARQTAAHPVLHVGGSPFHPTAAPPRDRLAVDLELPVDALVDLVVRDFDGRLVKVLATDEALPAGTHRWPWGGRDASGRQVPDGPYRVRASVRAGDSTKTLGRWVTRSRHAPYPRRPQAIVVAIDPGHGGPDPGAVHGGVEEAALNLDISLRLEAMLQGARVGVLMTRRTDRRVSVRGVDLNGDGHYDRTDELIARNDLVNLARADIRIAVHNNASRCHCVQGTSTYTHDRRTWSPEGRLFARVVQGAHLRRLDTFRGDGWAPRDLGVLIHPFMSLRPYKRGVMPRPSLQPSILGESLFVDHADERALLRRARVRTALAAAYFEGVARFLRRRRFGLAYDLPAAPADALAGATLDLDLSLTNSGHATSDGWRLVARLVPAVSRYDGRPLRGTVVASQRIPNGVAPGERTDLILRGIPMPAVEGSWLVKLDVTLPGGDSLGRHGVVGPQLRIRTTTP